jgi:hypothetical protein
MLVGFKILISEESPYFSHYACKMLSPGDFYFKSYKRKNSENSWMVIMVVTELSLRFRLELLQATSVARKISQV